MKKTLYFLLLASSVSYADCDFKKAARNKVLDEKVGISGKCNTEKALKNNVIKSTDDVLDVDSKAIIKSTTDIKNNTTNTAAEIKKSTDNLIKDTNKTLKTTP